MDINAQKPYYVAVDSTSTTTTTINKIEESDYDTGRDSTVPATGSALVGNFILYIERWLDVMAYLRMDLSTSSTAQSVLTSIKIDGLNITNVLASISQDAFKSTLKDQIVSELSIESDQVTIISLRSGSIIAEIELSSTGSSTKSAAEIDTDLQNYVAATTASTPSISSPLNTVNGFFYANESNDIMFTDCPYQITKTTLEGMFSPKQMLNYQCCEILHFDFLHLQMRLSPSNGTHQPSYLDLVKTALLSLKRLDLNLVIHSQLDRISFVMLLYLQIPASVLNIAHSRSLLVCCVCLLCCS